MSETTEDALARLCDRQRERIEKLTRERAEKDKVIAGLVEALDLICGVNGLKMPDQQWKGIYEGIALEALAAYEAKGGK